MSSKGLTEQDRQRLTQIKTQHQKQGSTTKIENCQPVREAFKHGQSLESLADEYDAVEETIREHLKGHCVCQAELDPLTMRGHVKSKYKICPHEDCGFGHRYFADLTCHINDAHTGGGE